MSSVDEELSLELSYKTNVCRMELVEIQSKYYMLIIKNLYLTFLRRNENIDLYSREELLDMLQMVENTVDELETESTIQGMQKYEITNSSVFIEQCMQRVMKHYNFSNWDLA